MTITERNRAIADAYRGGALQSAIAREFGLSKSNVSLIIANQGARLPKDELARRNGEKLRQAIAKPETRARIAAAVKQRWANGEPLGRKTILADDPLKRADYINLRDAYGAEYAREVMGIAA